MQCSWQSSDVQGRRIDPGQQGPKRPDTPPQGLFRQCQRLSLLDVALGGSQGSGIHQRRGGHGQVLHDPVVHYTRDPAPFGVGGLLRAAQQLFPLGQESVKAPDA